MFKTYGFGQSSFGMPRFGFGAVDTPPQSAIPTDAILHYDFNGNTVDHSASGLNGIQTGALSFVEGRKAGTQCADFVNGCIYTPTALPVNSNKVSVSFWINIRSLAFSCLLEMSTNASQQRGFASFMNDLVNNTIEFFIGNQIGTNLKYTDISSELNTWVHFVFTIDTSQVNSDITKIYMNNLETGSMVDGYRGEGGFNFNPNILFIGQRSASQYPFDGRIQDLRIYNRVLTTDERTALFNE